MYLLCKILEMYCIASIKEFTCGPRVAVDGCCYSRHWVSAELDMVLSTPSVRTVIERNIVSYLQ